MSDASQDPTSDRPTGQESDTMRQNYRTLTGKEQLEMTRIKQLGANFYDACNFIGESRELSLAKTKVEEAVMWAVKHITG